MFYAKAEKDMIAYSNLEIPYLFSRQLLPNRELLLKTDVQKAWRLFPFKYHPDKTGDRLQFDEMQKYFDDALQCFKDEFEYYGLPDNADGVAWDLREG